LLFNTEFSLFNPNNHYYLSSFECTGHASYANSSCIQLHAQFNYNDANPIPITEKTHMTDAKPTSTTKPAADLKTAKPTTVTKPVAAKVAPPKASPAGKPAAASAEPATKANPPAVAKATAPTPAPARSAATVEKATEAAAPAPIPGPPAKTAKPTAAKEAPPAAPVVEKTDAAITATEEPEKSAKPAAPKAKPKAAAKTAPQEKEDAAAQVPSLGQHEIDRLIAEAAYYLAEKRNFQPGFEQEDWATATDEVMARLKGA
jgi:hypothetical protein